LNAGAGSRSQGYTLTGPTGLEDVKLYLGPGVTLPYVTAYRAPGTSLWGALLYLVAGTRPYVFKLANLALDAILIGLIAAVARCGRLDAGAAGLAALSWALYPSAIFATGLFGSETLFAFLLVLIAWLFAWSDRRPLLGAALSTSSGPIVWKDPRSVEGHRRTLAPPSRTHLSIRGLRI